MALLHECGGYDVKFEVALPDDFVCSICKLAFRDPVQTECGHQFCHTCVERCEETQGNDLSCPIDREGIDMSKVFPDNHLKRKVLSLIVTCCSLEEEDGNNEEEGKCNWKGELRAFEEHSTTCPYAVVKCSNEGCGARMTRKELDNHLANACGFSYCICMHCLESMFRKDYQSHKGVCKRWPVHCINNCGKVDIPRENLEDHVMICPLSVLPCTYTDYGCQFKGTLSERQVHDKNVVQNHLMYAVETVRLNAEKIRLLEEKIAQLEGTQKSHDWKLWDLQAQQNQQQQSNSAW